MYESFFRIQLGLRSLLYHPFSRLLSYFSSSHLSKVHAQLVLCCRKTYPLSLSTLRLFSSLASRLQVLFCIPYLSVCLFACKVPSSNSYPSPTRPCIMFTLTPLSCLRFAV